MTDTSASATHTASDFGDVVSLLKPRVMSLVVFTAAVGLIVAPVSVHPFLGFCAILFIGLGAGASGALNMWWDADIDAIMKRTQSRPVPAGKVTAHNAMLVGLWMSVLSVAMLGLAANWFAAAFLAFTIFFYAVIYSMWLKRSTPQNIVIGGAAGAFPPMVGWAAATGGVSIEAWGMFMLIFMWTPPHFWALALFMNDDYTKAGVPMLTVTHGRRTTRKHIMVYTVLLTPFCIGLGFTSIGGPVYFLASLILSVMFLRGAYGLYTRAEETAEADKYIAERRVFKFSLFYLFILFAALLVEEVMRNLSIGLENWPVVI
ncbi:protoheme IX farnesyltransferase [Amylibacter marinus]|uniref:Protoheme IX farnesyltransferase n=1 Tax=Amylibacter marinus TaxID=1475483 RepID=A0ABQ5VUC2_9RHOB|nr:heme o synthase [Amylibacter marinus]GLQ34920.1 protoheme IX farnesyltransferase [Amylibacter marinus]